MKELDSFTVEQLTEFIESDHAQCGDIAALARIALAAKRAEPVGYVAPEALEYKNFYDVIMIENASGRRTMPLYGTPQLNYPEIPDGWKLVPIEPTQEMVDAHISGMQLAGFSRAYRDMLAAAPEKPL
ncbi:TPA: hypothetical protein ACVHP4_004254 [Yersinia enterocolitica]